MATVTEIKNLKAVARAWNLEDVEILDKYTDEELSKIYNGIGAASFPDWLRDAVNALNPTLEPVAMIHDVEWHETDQTKETWHKTNDRFRDNGYKAAKAHYGWYNPLRYLVMKQARVFRLACETPIGWKAWLAGSKDAVTKESVDATV